MVEQVSPSPLHFAEMTRMAYWTTQVIHVAAKFGIADILASPATAVEVAARAGLDRDSTQRLLRACVSLGLASIDENERYSSTALLATLCIGVTGSLRGFAVSQAAPGHWLPWGKFPEVIRSGKRQTLEVLGEEIWGYYVRARDEAAAFSEGMRGLTVVLGEEAASVIHVGAGEIVADIGGANGALAHAFLKSNPDARRIVFDRPNITSDAARRAGLTDRLGVVEGDFFQACPTADI